jgi:hypothetical protein
VILRDATGREERAYAWAELRFSISWKAYCFADAGERDAWRDHADDLELATVLGSLVADLRARGHDDASISSSTLGNQLIDEYVRFPSTVPEPASS